MAVVVKRVKAFGKGLLAVGAEVALMTIGHLAMFMGLSVSTEPTFHCLIPGVRCRSSSTLLNPHYLDALPLFQLILPISLTFEKKLVG